ncbi:hypothetical protein GF361_05670 [Candidatus Woesearchaeota archaeon]|nr:hypothetical protein [Candidatus Woesearchaeota archaeon]
MKSDFKIDKWYKYIFYGLGWLSFLNILFLAFILGTYIRTRKEYGKFLNPEVNKLIFIFGIFYAILPIVIAILSYLL